MGSTWETIKDLMEKYPGRIWTTPEIVAQLYPGCKDYEFGLKRSKIAAGLKSAEKYGLVKRCGYVKSRNNTLAAAWVLA